MPSRERALSTARRIPVALAFIALASTAGGQSVRGAPELPAPTGAMAVGTTVLHVVDSTRADSGTGGRFGGRPITVQLWYPTRRHRAAGPTAPYLVEQGLADSLIQTGYYEDTSALTALGRLRTHSVLDAPVASGLHPLVTLSPGFGTARATYTSIAEALASHGYLVAVFDHPHGGMMLLPDGRVASAGDDSTRWDDPRFHARQMNAWAADVSFLLDRLQARVLPTAANAVASAVDWHRVGATGHSSGGLAAVEACEHDPRVRVCVNMDGGLVDPDGRAIVDFARTGIDRPTLFLESHPIYRDSDLARRGRTRASFEKSGQAHTMALDTLPRSTVAPLCVVRVAGTGHMSFSDAPFVMPTTITRFGGQIIAPERGFVVITTVLRAFFDEQFGLRPRGSFAKLVGNYPELNVRQAGRARTPSHTSSPHR